jgi:hypothetical protein
MNEKLNEIKLKHERSLREFDIAIEKKNEEIEILNINYDRMVEQFENNLGRVLNY